MNNDQLQVLALILEITGFGLAFLHAFKPQISTRLSDMINSVLLAVGARKMDYAMPGVDYDDELKDEERGPAALGYFVFSMFSLFIIVQLSLLFDFGDGFLWACLEIALAIMAGPIVAILLHATLSTALNVLDSLLLSAGNGDYAVSFGFILAAIGLGIEVKQVFDSTLAWVLVIFPVLACLAVFMAIMSHRKK